MGQRVRLSQITGGSNRVRLSELAPDGTTGNQINIPKTENVLQRAARISGDILGGAAKDTFRQPDTFRSITGGLGQVFAQNVKTRGFQQLGVSEDIAPIISEATAPESVLMGGGLVQSAARTGGKVILGIVTGKHLT